MIKSGEGITILIGRLVVLLGAREPILPWYDRGFYLSRYLINWRSEAWSLVTKVIQVYIFLRLAILMHIHIHGPSINRV